MFSQFLKQRFINLKSLLRRGQKRQGRTTKVVPQQNSKFNECFENKPNEKVLRTQVDRDISAI